VLRYGDLPGELKYTLVFLCACGSALPGDERFADAFGAKAYMGWKGVMHAAAAVQFSLYFFEEIDERATVGIAASETLGRFTVGSEAYRWIHDNLNVVRGDNVVVDLRAKSP